MNHGTTSRTTAVIPHDVYYHPSNIYYHNPYTNGDSNHHDDDVDDDDDSMYDQDEMNEDESSRRNIACATVLCKVLTRNEPDSILKNGYCNNGREEDRLEEHQISNNEKKDKEEEEEEQQQQQEDHQHDTIPPSSRHKEKNTMGQDNVMQELSHIQTTNGRNCNHEKEEQEQNGEDADADDDDPHGTNVNDEKRKRKFEEINVNAAVQHSCDNETRDQSPNGSHHVSIANDNHNEERQETSSIILPLYSDLKPLPDAPSLPMFPSTGACEWTFDEVSRVLLGKFKIDKQYPKITLEDESFLLQMMERTDIAVVSEGLFEKNDCSHLWGFDFMAERAGDKMFHRFRRFESTWWTQEQLDLERIGETMPSDTISNNAVPDEDCFCHMTEIDGDISMKIRDYIRYIKTFVDVHKGHQTSNCMFTYKDGSGKDQSLDVKEQSVYMIDLDVKKFLPETAESFMENFLMPGVLPGGKYCMMNAVNVDGRPFMGPNLYLTPPGSFTHFHQDGHGTVDSGHLCIGGYNEVVMLRRMSERHMENALHFLKCNDRRTSPGLLYDALYGLPHHNGEKPLWPDNTAIENCKKFNYYPCVFVLKPGQLLHINKGRLHAFRKMSTLQLEANDCHSALRQKCIVENNLTTDCICMSIAWDWMYRGVTKRGMQDEVNHTLNSASLARSHGRQSLAIPQLSLIETAKCFLAKFKTLTSCNHELTQRQYETLDAIRTVLMGIYPGLKRVVGEQIEMIGAKMDEKNSEKPYRRVIVRKEPDSDNGISTVDPFGNDFFCFLCHQELANAYMHCNGCEELLQKDFNICLACHSNEDMLLTDVQMHPFSQLTSSSGRRTDFNHAPRKNRDMQRCGCKKGPACKRCKLMTCCSCKCHQEYSLRFRLYSIDDLTNLLNGVANAVVGQQVDGNSDIEEV